MSTVSGVSSLSSQYQANLQNIFKQWQENFDNLGTALQSSDMTAAQTAYSALLQAAPTGSQAQTSQKNGTTGIQSDFDTLGKAIQSGDTDAAKTAFDKLKQDLQTARAHHHHHHKQASGTESTPANFATDQLQTTNGISDSSSDSNTINITA